MTATSSSQHSGGAQSVSLQDKRREQINQSKRGIFFLKKAMLQLHVQTEFLCSPANDISASLFFSRGKGSMERSAVRCGSWERKAQRDGFEEHVEVTPARPLCLHTQEATQGRLAAASPSGALHWLPSRELLEADVKPGSMWL